MQKILAFVLSFLLLFSTVAAGFCLWLRWDMPPYSDNLGNENYPEKITGTWLTRESAQRKDNILIYGSSELRTTNISTHPSNFFKGKRAGFQVNLIGRGSCQSIIHALNIASMGSSLKSARVVLITSPQSYVPKGIAPDLFLANFSKEQFYLIMDSNELSDDIKQRFALRIEDLLREYKEEYGSYMDYEDLVSYVSLFNGGAGQHLLLLLLSPCYAAEKHLYILRDQYVARRLLIRRGVPDEKTEPQEIDWQAEYQAAEAAGSGMTSNNAFGILNDYYNTYIGSKLAMHKGKEKNLSYTKSKEYSDLVLLLDVCKELGVQPMFVHVPLHGAWSDFTGFERERREQYYAKVRNLVGKYDNVTMLDLTDKEYTPYFLCDVMHLGWNGWLSFNEALITFYNDRVGDAAR